MNYSPHTVHQRIRSPLGDIVLAATPLGLSGLWFDGQKHAPDWSAWPLQANAHTTRAAAQIAAYFEDSGTSGPFDVPLDLGAGTPFQQAVWQALLQIPSGRHCSYGQIAQRVGRPTAVRAVGAAVGRNPVSIIVPCHRVLGASGALTGYAGGLERKIALLQREGILL